MRAIVAAAFEMRNPALLTNLYKNILMLISGDGRVRGVCRRTAHIDAAFRIL
jgi:hypothetical protein